MRIGITGATGFIGSHLTEELARRGHEVTCLVRPTSDLRWLRGLPVHVLPASMSRPGDLEAFVRGKDAIVHTAGSKFAASRQDFARANEALTSTLLDAVERWNPGIRRFVYLSSMAVAGPSSDGRPLREDELPNPITFYGESKLRTERILASRAGRVPYTILRPPGVYGPRDRDILMVFQMAHRRLQLVIGRRNTIDLIYVKNLVHAICLVLDGSAGVDRTYHVADAHSYTWEQFTRRIHAAQGKPALIVKVPDSLLIVGGWVSQMTASWFGGEVKLNDQKVREMREPYWVLACDRAHTELGYDPPFAADRAIGETLSWYQEHRWL